MEFKTIINKRMSNGEIKREQQIAILTNNFVPCNGRFAPP